MTNYKPKHGDMELWLICAAINGDNDKILKMESFPLLRGEYNERYL